VQSGTLEVEFYSRSSGRYRIDNGEWFQIRPLVFGYPAAAEFEPTVSTLVPDLTGSWVLVFQDGAGSTNPSAYYSQMSYANDDPARGDALVLTLFTQELSTSESAPIGDLLCSRGENEAVICRFRQFYDRRGAPLNPRKEYFLELGNVTRHRIDARAPDGSRLEAHRVNEE
jgi:hypothetical protein